MANNSEDLEYEKYLEDQEYQKYLASSGSSKGPTKKYDNSFSGSAALQGAGQALTLGYLPQLQAGAESMLPDASGGVDEKLRREGFKLPDDSYVSKRDQFINRDQKLASENPVSYGSGAVAGTLVSAPILGAGGQAKTFLGGVGRAAGAGAVAGALQNPGDVSGEVNNPLKGELQTSSRLQNAGTGILYGGGTQGALSVASKLGGALRPSSLADFAKRRAASSAGFQKSDINRATKKLGPVGAKSKVEGLGEYAIQNDLVQSGDDIFATSHRISEKRNEIGAKLGEAYKQAQQKFSGSGQAMQSYLDPGEIAVQVVKKTDRALKGTSGYNQALPAVQKEAENLLSVDPTFEGLLRYRQSLDDVIYSPNVKADTPARKALERYRGLIDRNLNVAVRALKGKEGYQEIKDLKKQYSKLSDLASAAKNKVSGELGNSPVGLRDALMVAGGIGTMGAYSTENKLDDVLTGLAWGVASKTARKWGGPIATKAAHSTGSLLSKLPSVPQMGPEAAGAIGATLLNKKKDKKNGRQ